MKAMLINLGLRLFGLQGKLIGQHTKVGLAADALLIVSALLLAVVKSAVHIQATSDWGGGIALLIDSPELKAVPLLWTAGAVAGGIALKADKAVAVNIALAEGKTNIAKAVADGTIPPADLLADMPSRARLAQ